MDNRSVRELAFDYYVEWWCYYEVVHYNSSSDGVCVLLNEGFVINVVNKKLEN